MKFFATVAAAASLFATLASAYNGFAGPAEGEKIAAGQPYLIKWTADTPGPVHITLRKGARNHLDTLYDIVILEYNWGNYTWNVPADTAPAQDYAFMMKWGTSPGPDDVNYTGLFEITSSYGSDDSAPSSEEETATATETATETATDDSAYPSVTPTDTPTESGNSTVTHPTPTGGKNSTVTKPTTSATATNPPTTDDSSSATMFGASAGMAAAVAFAAAALL